LNSEKHHRAHGQAIVPVPHANQTMTVLMYSNAKKVDVVGVLAVAVLVVAVLVGDVRLPAN
jgi:hypothetical protein